MIKPLSRPISQHSSNALLLLDQLIREARIKKSMATTNLASRTRQQASQAMLIRDNDRTSQVRTCIAAASLFLLNQNEAISIVNHQVKIIEHAWQSICEEASLSEVDQMLLWRRQFLNPFAFLNAPVGVQAANTRTD